MQVRGRVAVAADEGGVQISVDERRLQVGEVPDGQWISLATHRDQSLACSGHLHNGLFVSVFQAVSLDT